MRRMNVNAALLVPEANRDNIRHVVFRKPDSANKSSLKNSIEGLFVRYLLFVFFSSLLLEREISCGFS